MNHLTDIRHGSDEWFDTRDRLITGSDADALFGSCRWRTPLDVWYRLALDHTEKREDNAFLKWGRIQEPVAAAQFAEITQMEVIRNDRLLVDEAHYMAGTPDAFLKHPMREDLGILELKAPTTWTAHEWDEGSAPEHYVWQLKFYLALAGLRWGALCALVGPRGVDSDLIATMHVEIADEEAAEIQAGCVDWYKAHVLGDEQPIAIARDMERLRETYGDAAARTIRLSTMGRNYFAVMRDAQQREKEAKATIDGARAALMQEMGEAMYAIDEDGNALTWKPRTDGVRVFKAAKKLPREAPEPETAEEDERTDDDES